MKKEDVKIGMKVVPFQKTVLTQKLEHSSVWEMAIKRNQKYLYVIDWDNIFKCFVLNEDNINDGNNGDFFDSKDFEPYEEDLKEKLLKLQKLYNDMMELQYEINGEFHDKSITISNILGSWNNGGKNLRIDRVDIRTDDVGVLFDIYENGEKIKCADSLEFDQFIENGELL